MIVTKLINFADDKVAMLSALISNPKSEYFSRARHIFPLPFRVEKGSLISYISYFKNFINVCLLTCLLLFPAALY